ncbi:M3 family metallopeptidase [Winogradskyella sp.]|nr:M3 family metallopeptidase [Winogradskyella sp.]
MTILNKPFNTPYNTAPFSKIKTEDYLPAFKIAIEKAKAEIDAIVNTSEAPSFKNTIEALDYSGEELDRISSLFFNLNSAETNDEIQKIAQEISPLLSEFSNDITLNVDLFKRVKIVYDNKTNLDLTTEQNTLLDKKYKGFSRNGANLPEAKKDTLRAIDKELSQLKLTFGEHILAETNAFEMHLTNEDDLSGLPDGAKEAAKQLAESKNKEGWLITLDYPSYIPFMTYADNRLLREKLSKAFGSKGFNNNDLDNQEIVLKIAQLRFKRAQLLGYKTHAHFVLEERMAKTPEKVTTFLNELLDKAKPAAKKEFTTLENFAKSLDGTSTANSSGIDKLQKWDSGYYAEKLKQKLFSLDDEQLKPYFKLENVINGAFNVAEKLFGLQFEEVQNIDKYHNDVLTYEVKDADGDLVSIFYADFFPRAGKRNGAWMTSYKPQMIKDSHNHRPHVSIVCNFTKPTKSKPSLLTFNEVTTLFHEFGHALHGMLANTTYPSLSGTSVFWDFVELPSQILENWCYEEETLKLFATHYETGAVIPMELIEKIKASATFHEGMQTLRQISFGLLDMSWHGVDPSEIKDVKAYEVASFGDTSLYPDVAENCMSTAFAHIFQGGYSSGYYSYKWAEVLDADAFEYFKEEGIFNKDVANKFKTFILSQGGTEDPMTLYKKFRGQEPKPEALLRRAGLLK